MGWIKEKYEEFKEDSKVKKEYSQQTKVQAREAYLQEKQKQALRIAQERAKIEADAKIARERERYQPRKSQKGSTFMGVMGAMQGINQYMSSGMGLGVQSQPTTRRTVVKRRKPSKTKNKSKSRKRRVSKSPPSSPQMGYQWGF